MHNWFDTYRSNRMGTNGIVSHWELKLNLFN